MPAICKLAAKFKIEILVGMVSFFAAGSALGQNYVGWESANPFTAERVASTSRLLPDGGKQTASRIEIVARDGYGRVGFGKIPYLTITKTDIAGVETKTTSRNIHGHIIDIFDRGRGTSIQLDTEQKTARTKEEYTPTPPNLVRHPYSSGFFSPANPKFQIKHPPNQK